MPRGALTLQSERLFDTMQPENFICVASNRELLFQDMDGGPKAMFLAAGSDHFKSFVCSQLLQAVSEIKDFLERHLSQLTPQTDPQEPNSSDELVQTGIRFALQPAMLAAEKIISENLVGAPSLFFIRQYLDQEGIIKNSIIQGLLNHFLCYGHHISFTETEHPPLNHLQLLICKVFLKAFPDLPPTSLESLSVSLEKLCAGLTCFQTLTAAAVELCTREATPNAEQEAKFAQAYLLDIASNIRTKIIQHTDTFKLNFPHFSNIFLAINHALGLQHCTHTTPPRDSFVVIDEQNILRNIIFNISPMAQRFTSTEMPKNEWEILVDTLLNVLANHLGLQNISLQILICAYQFVCKCARIQHITLPSYGVRAAKIFNPTQYPLQAYSHYRVSLVVFNDLLDALHRDITFILSQINNSLCLDLTQKGIRINPLLKIPFIKQR